MLRWNASVRDDFTIRIEAKKKSRRNNAAKDTLSNCGSRHPSDFCLCVHFATITSPGRGHSWQMMHKRAADGSKCKSEFNETLPTVFVDLPASVTVQETCHSSPPAISTAAITE